MSSNEIKTFNRIIKEEEKLFPTRTLETFPKNKLTFFIEMAMTSNELGRRTPSLNGPRVDRSKNGETLRKKKFAEELCRMVVWGKV